MVKNTGAIRERRMHDIVALISSGGSTTAEDLALALNVSVMTVYRDLTELETTGLILRTHGKISTVPFTRAESSALMRTGTENSSKRRLAKAALKLLAPGASVALDDSTTGLHFFPELSQLSPITVVTNARFIAERVLEYPRLELVQLGGTYVRWADAFSGPQTQIQARALGADFCIMSTTAISNGMCCHPDESIAAVKREMLVAAQTKVLLADRTKFTRSALHCFFPLEEIDVLITEKSVSPELLEDAKERVGRLITV